MISLSFYCKFELCAFPDARTFMTGMQAATNITSAGIPMTCHNYVYLITMHVHVSQKLLKKAYVF